MQQPPKGGSAEARVQLEYLLPHHSVFSESVFNPNNPGGAAAQHHPLMRGHNVIPQQPQIQPNNTLTIPNQQYPPPLPQSSSSGSSSHLVPTSSRTLAGVQAPGFSVTAASMTNINDADDLQFGPNADGELSNGCRKCGVAYGSSTELKLHFGTAHSRQTFECFVCNKLFLRRHGFLVHIKRFHEDVVTKSFPCPFCEQVYTNEAALAEHTAAHHKRPTPICPLCQKQVVNVKRHIQKVHQPQGSQSETTPKKEVARRRWPSDKIHHCTQCHYQTNRAERLRVHVQGVHNNERAYPCTLCEKRFKQRDKLSRHVSAVHLQQKPFSCEYCNMAFGRKDEVSRHVSIVHLGEKNRYRHRSRPRSSQQAPPPTPTPPTTIPTSTNTMVAAVAAVAAASLGVASPPLGGLGGGGGGGSSLPVHPVQVHHDEKVHMCSECSYTCERADKLKVHMLGVHSDVRPFPCQYCEKRFKLRDKLNLHINTVHLRKKPFSCQFCSQPFGRKDAAKRHQTKWCPMRPKEAIALADDDFNSNHHEPIVNIVDDSKEGILTHQT